jgi:BirA family biotin operon repressor/biotin-[acetyl-CoA-carboxylase] ligase
MPPSHRIDKCKTVTSMNEAAFNVLEILEKADGPISGEKISGQLGVTRSAVWKHIKELRDYGYEISASRAEGYRLDQRTDRLLPHEVKKFLKTAVIGRQMRYHSSTASTTWIGRELMSKGDAEALHGTVIVAEEQTGGVGRLGRAWVSPKGGVWFTILLKPTIPLDHLFMITMAGSIAVARAIRKEYDLGALIKWPNDIYIGDKKVSGLLLELSAEADTVHSCLLGIGIDANISPANLPPTMTNTITSISSELGTEVNRAKLLARLLKEFEQRYLLLESEEYDSIIREWKSLSFTLDHRVHIRTLKKSFDGEAIDIDEHGALIVRKNNGKIERVIAGDCFQQ